MSRHKNKHIQKAIEYAEERGWRVVKASGQAHIGGKLYCPAQTRGGCIVHVYSTPRVPEHHARHIRDEVDDCPHMNAIELK